MRYEFSCVCDCIKQNNKWKYFDWYLTYEFNTMLIRRVQISIFLSKDKESFWSGQKSSQEWLYTKNTPGKLKMSPNHRRQPSICSKGLQNYSLDSEMIYIHLGLNAHMLLKLHSKLFPIHSQTKLSAGVNGHHSTDNYSIPKPTLENIFWEITSQLYIALFSEKQELVVNCLDQA